MYDIAIIGAGPAGLTAAIYGQRYGLKTVVFGDVMGGLVVENPFIENYPGLKLVNGAKLGADITDHAKSLGAEIKQEKIKSVEKTGKGFSLVTEWDTRVEAKTVIIAHGLKRRKLGAKHEEKFYGKGISFCAACDGAFFKDKVVAVIGGGDSAGVSALILSALARKVHIIYRRDKLVKMNPAYVKKIEEDSEIEVILNDTVTEALGKDKLEGLKLKSGRELKVDGFFIDIGFEPEIPFETSFGLELDKGFIKVDKDQSTNEPGVFASGDITTASNSFHQIATAIGEGAVAADSANKFLLQKG